MIVKANTEWGLVVKDSNSITRGYMTKWTGTGWGSRKLSKPLQVVVQNRAFKIDKGEASVFSGGMTGDQGQEVFFNQVQDISNKDTPLPAGSTYRIVLGLEGVPAEERAKEQKAHSRDNQLEREA